jgi:hypothetical protein
MVSAADPLRAGNRTRYLWVSSQEFWSLDHRGGRLIQTQNRKTFIRACSRVGTQVSAIVAHEDISILIPLVLSD